MKNINHVKGVTPRESIILETEKADLGSAATPVFIFHPLLINN
jgi:hypothetical protein